MLKYIPRAVAALVLGSALCTAAISVQAGAQVAGSVLAADSGPTAVPGLSSG
jgi:hypothetical protein